MKAEEKVKILSEELKRVNGELSENLDRYLSTVEHMNESQEVGYYDDDEYYGLFNVNEYLADERKVLSKRQEKLVKKLRKIIARRKLTVDAETTELLNNLE